MLMKNNFFIEEEHDDVNLLIPSDKHIESCLHYSSVFLKKAINVCIVTVSEIKMASLNIQYRNKTGSTNVLSFPDESPQVEGTIYFCPQVIDREKPDSLAHWSLLLVHSILHLAGYTHENDSDAEIMEKAESEILRNLPKEYI